MPVTCEVNDNFSKDKHTIRREEEVKVIEILSYSHSPSPSPNVKMSTPSSHTINSQVVGTMQYDSKVARRSIEDPHRQHRRSSIPFADRKPAVRFIRAIDSLKASLTGPHDPRTAYQGNKPILKKSEFPILVKASELGLQSHGGSPGGSSTFSSTNDELDLCRFKAEIIMDKISKVERIARGALDVLTFPTCTRRVEALSRYQGCMAISVSIIDHYTQSEAYVKQQEDDSPHPPELEVVLQIVQSMSHEADIFQATAKKFLQLTFKRYNGWDDLLKRSTEFKIDHSRLCYPIYTHKKMPESVTLFEDSLDTADPKNNNAIDGYMRVFRQYPDGSVLLYCDLIEETDAGEEGMSFKPVEPINFMESSNETRLDIIKYIVTHGKDLLSCGNTWLTEGLNELQDKELNETFMLIQKKINGLQYDEYFDPLCALEFKAALGELITRKAELLNTAEQIVIHCKWIIKFTNTFRLFAKRRVKGDGICTTICTCSNGDSLRSKLFNLLGTVSMEDVTVLMPLTLDIFQDIFHINPYQAALVFAPPAEDVNA